MRQHKLLGAKGHIKDACEVPDVPAQGLGCRGSIHSRSQVAAPQVEQRRLISLL